ncbi:Asp23/Gls24 family envelope stress response protein [Lutibacter sp. B2]|nr:Asp23/Gls24 family envelope stress response protein [Lutibacter sp. B2]
MKVFALVGKSGTGKSYRAMSLAYEKEIECIVDDGLLIKGNKILAGKSAKRQSTSVGAVKIALFIHEDHKEEVKKEIEKIKPESILLLGTSNRMVEKIASHLGIGVVDEYISIDEISTEEERIMAQNQRIKFGKHVIPVPTFEIKKDFSGYFIDKLRILKKKNDTLEVSEKSIVRPTFSYMGKYTISNKVIIDLVAYIAQKSSNINKILKTVIKNHETGISIIVEISVFYGEPIQKLVKEVQKQVRKEVEYITALNIESINILVKNISFKK